MVARAVTAAARVTHKVSDVATTEGGRGAFCCAAVTLEGDCTRLLQALAIDRLQQAGPRRQ